MKALDEEVEQINKIASSVDNVKERIKDISDEIKKYYEDMGKYDDEIKELSDKIKGKENELNEIIPEGASSSEIKLINFENLKRDRERYNNNLLSIKTEISRIEGRIEANSEQIKDFRSDLEKERINTYF